MSFHTSHLILLMHSCEIVITPHDGTTDDLLCLSAVFSTAAIMWYFDDHCAHCACSVRQCRGDIASAFLLWGSFLWQNGPVWTLRVSCWFMLQSNHLSRLSAMLDPANARGNGASNLVSALSIKLNRGSFKHSDVIHKGLGVSNEQMRRGTIAPETAVWSIKEQMFWFCMTTFCVEYILPMLNRC